MIVVEKSSFKVAETIETKTKINTCCLLSSKISKLKSIMLFAFISLSYKCYILFVCYAFLSRLFFFVNNC